jgi:hypothetical protein
MVHFIVQHFLKGIEENAKFWDSQLPAKMRQLTYEAQLLFFDIHWALLDFINMLIKYFTYHDLDYMEAKILFEFDTYLDKWQFMLQFRFKFNTVVAYNESTLPNTECYDESTHILCSWGLRSKSWPNDWLLWGILWFYHCIQTLAMIAPQIGSQLITSTCLKCYYSLIILLLGTL